MGLEQKKNSPPPPKSCLNGGQGGCIFYILPKYYHSTRLDFILDPPLTVRLKMDGTVSQRCVSKFKIEVRICIPAIQ